MSTDARSLLFARFTRQELQHGWRHFQLFLACLILGVAVITTVNSLGKAIRQGLAAEAQSLLGGDVEISLNGRAATSEELTLMQRYGTVSHIATLRSMLQWQDMPTLVELKAVDSAYPLLGNIELADNISLETALANDGIAVDGTLLTQIGAKLGDRVQLGTQSYRIAAIIKREPDKVVQIFSFGPRVMLSHEALHASGLVSDFSLIKHAYRIVLTDKTALSALRAQLKQQFPTVPWQIQTGTDGNQTLKRFLAQLIAFLTLCGFATFLIGGIGIGSTVRTYMEKKSQSIAIMKTLGASRRLILCLYLTVIGILGLIGCVIGIGLALAITSLLLPVIATWLPLVEAGTVFDGQVIALSLWYGMLILYLFSLPALLGALETRPALLFRSATGIAPIGKHRLIWIIEIVLVTLLAASMIVTASDKPFILGALAMTALTLGIFAGCVHGIQALARLARVRRPWLRLALSNLYRPGATTGTVIFAIGISVTVLLSLVLTEANFQARITRIIDEQAPSLFMMDIQPHQQAELTALLHQQAGKNAVMIYPMVRGRITALNGKPVHVNQVAEDVRWAVRGDRGLSYSDVPPANANIVQGNWWPAEYRGTPLISVDERFLEGMRLTLGDTITLNVLGQEITATIASARRIDYTTFQINFAMMLSPGVIDQFPHSYLATVYLKKDPELETHMVKTIAKQFPGVTIIRTHQAVDLVKEVMMNISRALRIAVIISLITGLLVLASAMSAMIEKRLYDTAILKVLGARRRDILKIYTTEWMLLGLVTSCLASFIATLCAWLIMQRFRGEGFYLLPTVTLTTTLCCLGVIWLISYLGNRRIFSLKPASLLRNE